MSRTRWASQKTHCFLCGAQWELETHELLRGVYRQHAIKEPATWLRACSRCHHDRLHKAPKTWDLATQLAVKYLHDPEHYDREAVNEIRFQEARQRDPSMGVTEREVALACHELITKGLIFLP